MTDTEKISEKISTHLLTVLTKRVNIQLFQGEQNKKDKYSLYCPDRINGLDLKEG